MKSDVCLSWANKDLKLVADGEKDYQWVDEETLSSLKVPVLERLTSNIPEDEANLMILGDGLDALEALGGADDFLGSVKLVYVDPPFNTRKTFSHYSDSLNSAEWLSLFRDRIEAIKPFLSPGASVWVHLDDSESHRARMVMDEVFGVDSFISTVVWQKRKSRDSRSTFSSSHDTLVVYSLSGAKGWKPYRNLLPKNASDLKNRDNDSRGPWSDAPFTAPGIRKAQQYKIVTPTGVEHYPPRGRSWYATEPTYRRLLAENKIWFPSSGSGKPRIKLFADELQGLVPPSLWLADDVGTNDDAKRHLLDIFPGEVFDTPKPEELLQRIIHISTSPGERVIDIFGGSMTTAAVAHKMGRKWVSVERNHKTFWTVGVPRLTAVIHGADEGGITNTVGWQGGGGFLTLKVEPRLGKVKWGSSLEAELTAF